MTPHAMQRRLANAVDTPAKAAIRTDAAHAKPGLPQHEAEAAPLTLALRAGQVLHEAGAFTDDVWRVDSGALRLDLVGEGSEHFVMLALQGDHLGVEAHCGLPTLYRATAVTACVLRRLGAYSEPAQREVISGALVQQWCRAADQMALRTGSAGERVRRLLLLLAGGGRLSNDGWTAIELPCLADIAAIVDIAPETGSRILSHWRRQGLLQSDGAGAARLHGRRLAASAISTGIMGSKVREDAAPGRSAPLVRSRS